MSTRVTRSSLKRGVDAQENTQPSKRSKSNPTKPPAQSKKTTTKDNPLPSCDMNKPQAIKSRKPAKTGENKPSERLVFSLNLRLPESTGDIFFAPWNSLLIHACNSEGSWGAGIAKAFKDNFPNAYEFYHKHCLEHGAKLHSKALLIRPQNGDGPGHFIGCLFTSRSKGKKKDSPVKILEATGPAMWDLLEQVREWNRTHIMQESIGEMRMCKINSGLFGVQWEKTKALLEEVEVTEKELREIKVVSREE